MKIRWTENSLRFRISPTELDRLTVLQEVAEQITFPGGGFWKVSINPTHSETRLQFVDGAATVFLSDLDIEHLMADDVEGVYFGGAGQAELRYMIEKDFPCVHPRASEALDSPSETFAAPDGFADRKLQPG